MVGDITFSIDDTTHYAIDATSGEVTLTAAGAVLVNGGGNMPDFNVTAASTTGETSTASVAVNPTDTTTVNDPPVGLPHIAGTPTFGQILTADGSSIQDADGLGTLNYQWLRDGVAISGATNSSYALVGADIGARISVEVHYTDGGGTAESITSVQTVSVVGPVEPESTPRPDPDSDTQDDDQPEIDEDPKMSRLKKSLQSKNCTEEKQNGDTQAAEFDFAAMVGEIQPIGASEFFGTVSDQDQNRPNSDRAVALGGAIQPKWIDLKNLDIKAFEVEGLDQIEIPSVMDNSGFLQGLEAVEQDLDDAANRADANYKLGTEAAVGVTLSLSAGFVSWVLRTGSLMASFMSVVPMWKQLDPLPILGAAIVKGKKKVGSQGWE